MQDSTLHELEMIHVKTLPTHATFSHNLGLAMIHVKTLPTHATFSHNLGLAMIRVKMFTIHGKVRMI